MYESLYKVINQSVVAIVAKDTFHLVEIASQCLEDVGQANILVLYRVPIAESSHPEPNPKNIVAEQIVALFDQATRPSGEYVSTAAPMCSQ